MKDLSKADGRTEEEWQLNKNPQLEFGGSERTNSNSDIQGSRFTESTIRDMRSGGSTIYDHAIRRSERLEQ